MKNQIKVLVLSLMLVVVMLSSLHAEIIPADGSVCTLSLSEGVYEIEMTGYCKLSTDGTLRVGPMGESIDGGATWGSCPGPPAPPGHTLYHGIGSSISLVNGVGKATGPCDIQFWIIDDIRTDNASSLYVTATKALSTSDTNKPEQKEENKPKSSDEQAKDKVPAPAVKIDPVNVTNGELYFSKRDFTIKGRVLDVSVKRNYRSNSDYNSQFGYGWDMNYNAKVRPVNDGRIMSLENFANTEGDASNSSYGGSHITLIPEPWIKSYCFDESEATALGLGGDSGWNGYNVWYTAQVDWTTPHKITRVECVSEAVRNPTGIESLELKIDGVWTQINSRNSVHSKDTLVETGSWGKVTGIRNVKSAFPGTLGDRNYHKTYELRAFGPAFEGLTSQPYAIIFMDGSNNKEEFALNADSGHYENSKYNTDYFEYDQATGYTLNMAHGVRYFFDVNGNLSEIKDKNDNTLTFQYSSGKEEIEGVSEFFLNSTEGSPETGVIAKTYLLEKIIDDRGMEIDFSYYLTTGAGGSKGLLEKITYKAVPGNISKDRVWTYTYDSYNNLKTVTEPVTDGYLNGLTTTYNYGENPEKHVLTSVIDPEQQTYLVNTYTDGKVTGQQYGTGVAGLSYDPVARTTTTTTTIDTNGNQSVLETVYNDSGSIVSDTITTDLRDPLNPQSYTTGYQYYADGEAPGSDGKIKKITYPRLNYVEYEYHDTGNVKKMIQNPVPGSAEVGTTIVTEYTYEPSYNFIKTIKDPRGNLITYTYDHENACAEGLVINEFMALNSTGQDWIEIYNPTGSDIDMKGMILADNSNEYEIGASLIIYAGSYLRFWADTGNVGLGGIYATFGLSAGGEEISLKDSDGTVIDYIEFGPQVANKSQGRSYDGGFVWQTMSNPTPNTSNIGSSGLVINEFMADNTDTLQDPADNLYQDWIEIYNPTGAAIDMQGMTLADDTTQYLISESLIINAGGYLIFWADNESAQGMTHTTFGLGKSGDQISLFDVEGNLIDKVEFGVQGEDVSYARFPDGGQWRSLSKPNPGQSNSFQSGNLIAITYPQVNTPDGLKRPKILFTYNSVGQTETITSPDGVVTEYEYYDNPSDTDNFGRVKRITYDKDQGVEGVQYEEIVVEYAYDEAGNAISITDDPDYLAIETMYQYNELDQLKMVIPPAPYSGLTTQYDYTENKKVEIVTRNRPNDDPTKPQIMSLDYDILDNLKTITDPLGNITTNDYDLDQHVNKITDAGDAETDYLYDERGLLWKVTEAATAVTGYSDAEDTVTEYSYDENGNLTEIKIYESIVSPPLPRTQITTYTYDGFDRLKKVTYPDGSYEEYEYDLAGNLEVYTNRSGDTVTFTYDALGRVVTEVSDQSITYLYDIASRPDTITQDDLDTTFTYDRLGRVDTVTDMTGKLVGYDYDSLGRQNKLVYPDHVDTTNESYVTYHYDELSRLTDIKDVSGVAIAHYTYDDLSRRVTVEYDYNRNGTPEGSIAYDYEDGPAADDNLGDRIEQIANTIISASINFDYTYDDVGNRLTEGNDSGIYDFGYDQLYQLVNVDKDSATPHTFDYDPFGNRETVSDGTAKTYLSDNMNKYISTDTDFYSYDKNGNLTGDGDYIYTYDSQNRLVGVAPVSEAKTSATSVNQTATTYDPGVLAFGTTYYWWIDEVDSSSQITPGDIWGFTTKDNASIPSIHTDKGVYAQPDNAYVNFTNAAGFNGDRVYITGGFVATKFTNNQANFPTNPEYSSGINDGTVDFILQSYYPEGYYQAILMDYAGEPDPSWIAYSPARTFFAIDNTPQDPSKATYPNPASGSGNVDNDVDLSWTAASSAVSHKVYVTAADTVAASFSYAYDYAGRRISKTVDDVTTQYVYDGDQVIAEYDDHVTVDDFQLVRKYIYGPGIDEPIVMINVDGVNETWYFYHYDGLGSVIALSNQYGQIVEKYSYDAFGNTTVTLDGSTGNPYRFTGRRWDEETGLYYYRARMYSPAMGRFLQTDPIGYDDGMNMYAYCGNNPVNWIDPFGLKDFTREETIEFINKTMESGWSPIHHLIPANLDGDLKIGQYDYKYSGHTFNVPEYGKMTSSEFGNYIAGYLAKANWGKIGSGGMRLGGHLYAFADAFRHSIISAFGKCEIPNYSDFIDDPLSRRDIQRGVDHAIRVLDSVDTDVLPPVDPVDIGNIGYNYGNWLEDEKKGS